ncbi:hypothetical protein [Ferruginibacter albus]|nr:hypothetical protein [Ferruginibacter albus]UAY53111.1 hypothetical protein K9M53_05405 [Ferruginibacter albus]
MWFYYDNAFTLQLKVNSSIDVAMSDTTLLNSNTKTSYKEKLIGIIIALK